MSRTSLPLLKNTLCNSLKSINLSNAGDVMNLSALSFSSCSSMLRQKKVLIFKIIMNCFQIEIMMGIVFIGFKLNKAHDEAD